MLKQNFYRFIYNPKINYLLRNFYKPLGKILSEEKQIPPSGILNLKTDSGTIKVATNQTSYLTKILFWKGYKNFEYSKIFEILVKKANTFIDIGSNIGYYSLLAAKSNPDITVIAFEPAYGPKKYLKENIALNNFQDIISHTEYALSDSTESINFYEVKSTKYPTLIHNLSGEHNAGTKTTSRNFVKTTVPAITFKDFIEAENIQTVDLIKIDTEGTEVEILKSAEEYIKKFEPIIICETLFNTTEIELEAFFKKLKYLFYNFDGKNLVKVESIRRDRDNGIRNCFFVPVSKEQWLLP
jgi:FkbM family methyltransferase